MNSNTVKNVESAIYHHEKRLLFIYIPEFDICVLIQNIQIVSYSTSPAMVTYYKGKQIAFWFSQMTPISRPLWLQWSHKHKLSSPQHSTVQCKHSEPRLQSRLSSLHKYREALYYSNTSKCGWRRRQAGLLYEKLIRTICKAKSYGKTSNQ